MHFMALVFSMALFAAGLFASGIVAVALIVGACIFLLWGLGLCASLYLLSRPEMDGRHLF